MPKKLEKKVKAIQKSGLSESSSWAIAKSQEKKEKKHKKGKKK